MREMTDCNARCITLGAVLALGCLLVAPASVIADAKQDQLLREALTHILKQDFAALEATLKHLDGAGAGEQAIEQSMNAVAGMPGIILDSFRRDIGKEIPVGLRAGKKALRITAVDAAGTIQAQEVIRLDGRAAGSTPRPFKTADLTVTERFNRLGPEETPERQIMRGLLAWETGKPEVAKKYFKDSKCALGDRLVARIFEMDVDAAAAATAAQKATRESTAAKAYADILKSAGLAALRGEATKLIAAIEATRFTDAQVADIRKNLRLLAGEAAETDVAKDNKAALESFALVRPNFPITVDQATLDKAIEELAKDNPKEVIHAAFERTGRDLTLVLRKLPALTDISALAGLPITHLVLDCHALSDLRPLAGMPLKSLSILCPAVTDITPLGGLPLEELQIGGYQCETRVANLSPLKGMRLKSLVVCQWSCGELQDLTPLAGMPLVKLEVQSQGVTDIRPLQGMLLEALVLKCPKVADLKPLTGMPLRDLNVGTTAATDLRPLRGMPLKVLRPPKNASDLTPVKDIPNLKIER